MDSPAVVTGGLDHYIDVFCMRSEILVSLRGNTAKKDRFYSCGSRSVKQAKKIAKVLSSAVEQ